MSENTEAYFAEVFEFAASSREDVKKMAIQGIAQHSRDNQALNSYICAFPEKTADVLLSNFDLKHMAVLGDVLTTFVNTAADTSCAESLVTRRVVTRTMRLLDSLEASDHTAAIPLKELCLIFLNNITASHVTAIDDLLQLDDEDLRGFYLTKLATIYERQPEDAPRNIKKWILHIVLNLTRTPEGQRSVLGDEEWTAILSSLISSPEETYRMLVAQVLRNCANNKDVHGLINASKMMPLIIARIHKGEEKVNGILQLLIEFVGGMLQSAEGIDALEQFNTKKYFQHALANGHLKDEHGEFVTNHILPYLDDIQDAYVMEE